MPVTQRWVHGGLILAVVVLSMSLTVLSLGAFRAPKNDAGLPGAVAASFRLKDSLDKDVVFDRKDPRLSVVVFVGHQSQDFAKYSDIVSNVVETYGNDPEIHLLGVAFERETTFLGPNATLPSALEQRCPGLSVGLDRDGHVARAYRVSEKPTLFIVSVDGLIKHRVELDQEGAGMTVTMLLQSLRGSSIQLPPPLLSDSRRL